MSSDTFSVEVLSISGDTAELLCTTSTAGGINDYAATRSFALMALADGMGYGANTPLQQGVAAAGGRVWEQRFHEENVEKFIAETRLLERIGVVLDEGAWRRGRWADSDEPDEDNFPLHRFKLRVRVTDPKYLEGLKKRSRWGTTAYDAWWNDPTRQPRSELDRVKTSYWTPKPREKAAKSGAKKAAKSGAAKAGAKKAAKSGAAKAGAKKVAKSGAAKAGAKKTAKRGASTAKVGAKKTAKRGASTAKAGAKQAAKRGASTAKAGAKKAAKAKAKKAAKRGAAKAGAKKTAKSGAAKAAKSGAAKAAKSGAAKAAKRGAAKAGAKKTAKRG